MDHNERHKKYNCNKRSEGLVPKITRGKKQNLFGSHVQTNTVKYIYILPHVTLTCPRNYIKTSLGRKVKCTFNVINYWIYTCMRGVDPNWDKVGPLQPLEPRFVITKPRFTSNYKLSPQAKKIYFLPFIQHVNSYLNITKFKSTRN